MKRYKISVKTLQGNYLTFTVSKFEVVDAFVVFVDEKTNKEKRFAQTNTEIVGFEE